MFLLSDLAKTTSENEGLALTITPEASLEADFVIRYFITGAGLHPASSGSFLYASGAFEFARGTTAALTTTIDDVLNAFKMTGQTNTWSISQLNTADDSGDNDPTELDTLVHYSFYGSSEYYIRFIFEDLDFDLTASHFEIV